MAERKRVDLSAVEWRIEPDVIPADMEALVAEDLRFCKEVSNLGGLNDDFEHLRRHNGQIISGYFLVRGIGGNQITHSRVGWLRLRERQQQALNRAFALLKALNGAGPMPELMP